MKQAILKVSKSNISCKNVITDNSNKIWRINIEMGHHIISFSVQNLSIAM